jgi:MoaA/NifB/PqqE/SkfB family radical SAM enzyme
MSKPKLFCSKPFEFFEVDSEGNVWVCCQDWLDKSIGNLSEKSLPEVWNSQSAQEIRQSMLDGSFRFCNQDTCPKIVASTLKKSDDITRPYLRKIIDQQLTVLEDGPRILNLGYDNTCNLFCKSCRPHLIALTGDKFRLAELMQKRLIEEGLKSARSAIITGHGDAFASRLYRKLLQELDARDYPKLRIDLMTNGLLFTPSMWNSMTRAHGCIRSVSISIDAATEETYRINRSGGDFQKLLKNLEFIGGLRTAEKIEWFEISFVAQKNNYREMKQFVELGKLFHCDSVLFQKIINWGCGTYTNEEFEAVAIHQASHPDYQSFIETLSDPALLVPVVDLGNLTRLAQSSVHPVTE